MIFHDVSLLLQLSCTCNPPFCSIVRFLYSTRKQNCHEREKCKPLCHFAFHEGYGPPRLRRAVAAPLNQLHPWRQWPVQGKSGKVFQHFEFIVCIGGQTGSAYVLPLLAGWYKFFFLVPFPLHFTSFPSYHHILPVVPHKAVAEVSK